MIFSDHPDIVLLLIDEGADYKIKDKAGELFINWVLNRDHFESYVARVKKNHAGDGNFLKEASIIEAQKEHEFSDTDRFNALRQQSKP